MCIYIYIYIYRVQNVFLRCLTPRLHCFLSSHWPSFRFLSFMVFFIPSILFFFGLPRVLLLTCKRYALKCCLHLQGAKVSQIAEYCSLFSIVVLSSISILLNNTLYVSLFPFKGILYKLSFLSSCCRFVHCLFFCCIPSVLDFIFRVYEGCLESIQPF